MSVACMNSLQPFRRCPLGVKGTPTTYEHREMNAWEWASRTIRKLQLTQHTMQWNVLLLLKTCLDTYLLCAHPHVLTGLCMHPTNKTESFICMPSICSCLHNGHTEALTPGVNNPTHYWILILSSYSVRHTYAKMKYIYSVTCILTPQVTELNWFETPGRECSMEYGLWSPLVTFFTVAADKLSKTRSAQSQWQASLNDFPEHNIQVAYHPPNTFKASPITMPLQA